MSETLPPRFACDAMLGGLARWLRAAGYDATWHDGIDDGELVRLGRDLGRTLLSSDDDIFGYALVRDGAVSALFVPRGLEVQAQLAHVLGRLGLQLREPRCMSCGGELVELTREAAAGRVPARSLERHAQFWECRACGQAFWHGTHWENIAARLRAACGTEFAPDPSDRPAEPGEGQAMDDRAKKDKDRPLASPYGPQYGHIDEAAGGADSSPYENLSSDEKAAAARRDAAERDKSADD